MSGWISVADRLPPSGVPVIAFYRNSAGMNRRIRAEYIAKNTREQSDDIDDLASEYDEETDTFYWPAGSTLWAAQGLPLPRCMRDAFGGWTLPITQHQWGHRAEKATWLYIVGTGDLAPMPLVLGEPSHVVQSRRRTDYRPHITKPEREHTPIELARWLVELAGRCRVGVTA